LELLSQTKAEDFAITSHRIHKAGVGLGDVVDVQILARLDGHRERVGDVPRLLPSPDHRLRGELSGRPFDIAMKPVLAE